RWRPYMTMPPRLIVKCCPVSMNPRRPMWSFWMARASAYACAREVSDEFADAVWWTRILLGFRLSTVTGWDDARAPQSPHGTTVAAARAVSARHRPNGSLSATTPTPVPSTTPDRMRDRRDRPVMTVPTIAQSGSVD